MSGKSAETLETEIRELSVDSLKLEEIAPGSIDVDEPLIDGALGLDSIAALEIGIALRKRYNIVIESATEEVKSHFQNVRNLAAFDRTKQQSKRKTRRRGTRNEHDTLTISRKCSRFRRRTFARTRSCMR